MENPNFYAIIPANVRYADITPNAKLLYGEITALCNKEGYCYATNQYFANLYNVSKISISKWIKELVENGFIESEIKYKEGSKEILNRYIKIVYYPIKEKFNTPIKEKFKDNNTYNNITFNNNIYMQDFEVFWKEYPKQRAGNKDKAYKAFCKAINEKRTTVDLLLESVKRYALSDEVIRGYAKGCAAWLNDDRFNNQYKVNKQEEKILIDENMRIDEDMIEFKDMTWEECNRASEWLLKNKYCQEITKEQFVELVRKFRNDRR